jgi:hypothetical protein
MAKDKNNNAPDIKGWQAYANQVKRINASIANIQKSLAATEKSVAKAVAGYTRMGKAHERNQSQIDKLMRSQQKLIGQYQKLAQAAEKATKGGGFFGGGFGFNLPTFVSVAAITAATKAWIDLTLSMSHAHSKASALAMGRDMTSILPYRRDADLFSQFAQQRFSNRFASMPEIGGLKKLREALSQSLGEDFGTELSLKLTKALSGNRRELTRFLVQAQTDVPAALRAFEEKLDSVDEFALALAGVTMQENELSRAASGTEQVLRDIREIWEDLATIAAPILNDITAKIHEATGSGSTFRNTIIDMAQAGVIGLYQFGDQVRSLMGDFTDLRVDALELQKLWFNIKHPGVESGILGGKKKYQDQAMVDEFWSLQKGIEDAHKRAASLRTPSTTPERIAEIAGYFSGLKQTMNDNARSFEEAQKKAEEERKRLLDLATPAEKAKNTIDDLNDKLREQSAVLQLAQSRVAAAQSNPFGWAEGIQATIEHVHVLDDTIGILKQKLAETLALDQSITSNRIEAMRVETEINQKIAERNNLLKSQARGYLDAIQAQAFTHGRFSKIIITQEHAVLRGLRSGMVKENKLLGAAEWSPIAPFQYTGNIGFDVNQYTERQQKLAGWYGKQNMAMMPPIQSAQIAAQRLAVTTGSVVIDGPAVLPSPSPAPAAVTTGSATVATGRGDEAELAALHRRISDIHARRGREERSKGPQAHGLPETNLRYPDVNPF